MIRIGQGLDIHPFCEGRALILGGVNIPHTHGLQGHSDADALTHAICDALLGALSLGDLGKYYSDTDPAHKNRNSLEFLKEIYTLVQKQGYVLANLDSTILTEFPKLAPYISEMKTILAECMHVQENQISIKATRPEKMGAYGRQEGLLVTCVVLLQKNPA